MSSGPVMNELLELVSTCSKIEGVSVSEFFFKCSLIWMFTMWQYKLCWMSNVCCSISTSYWQAECEMTNAQFCVVQSHLQVELVALQAVWNKSYNCCVALTRCWQGKGLLCCSSCFFYTQICSFLLCQSSFFSNCSSSLESVYAHCCLNKSSSFKMK